MTLTYTQAIERWKEEMGENGWVGVDFDGTLAKYEGWKGPGHAGEPVARMLFRVLQWLKEGRDVRIFTARVSHDGTRARMGEADIARATIQAWCLRHLGQILPVTNEKDYAMIELWDDRCVQVKPNSGERVDGRN